MPDTLPTISETLAYGTVLLRLQDIKPADTMRGLVPFYHFRIESLDNHDLGHINFRVGDTPHILQVAGHIGYAIAPEFRGKSFSYAACLALRPAIRMLYSSVIITSDPTNAASIRIIEKLGARFLNEVAIPPHDQAYASGARIKRRYEWKV